MLRAVIFDFDGVITDSEVLHLRAFNNVLTQYGVEIITKDYYKDYLGLTDHDCFGLLARKGRLRLDAGQIENLVREKNRIFEKLARTEGRIIEGVREFLGDVRAKQYTNGDMFRGAAGRDYTYIGRSEAAPFFDVIVSAEYVKKGKPNPEGFLLTLQKLNQNRQIPIASEQCIVIEDSHWGLEAARAAAMHTVAVTNSYDADQLSMAEKVVTGLGQLSIKDLQELFS